MVNLIGLLILLVRLFTLLLIVRIIVEMVQSFSQSWRPQRWFIMLAEPIFAITDPPVKGLRKLIPPLNMGGVALDVSVLVLFFGLQILQTILHSLL